MTNSDELPAQIGQYAFLEELGSGAFAVVYKAQHVSTMTLVAIKVISKKQLRNKIEFELLQREVGLIRSMDHPFVALFYEGLEDDKNFYLVQELVENGNLLDYVNHHKGLSENEAAHIFIQLISVLEYLHNVRQVAHRDLKAENVLLDRNNNVRLVDFGLSKAFTRDDPFLKTTCGSPAYVAPEVVREQPYTSAADVWSAGVLLYAMVVGCLPFNGDNISFMLQQILLVNPKMPRSLSPELKDLLTRLLIKDPKSRITIFEIEDHPWLKDRPESRLFRDKDLATFNIKSYLDAGVLAEMRVLRYDTNNLAQELQEDDINHRTAVYKMLRRQRAMDEMNDWQKTKFDGPMTGHAITEALKLQQNSVTAPAISPNDKLPPLKNRKNSDDFKPKAGVAANPTGLKRIGEKRIPGPKFQARMRKRSNLGQTTATPILAPLDSI